jgi:hypothetical protein
MPESKDQPLEISQDERERIDRMLRKMRSKDPVRHLAVSILEEPSVRLENIIPLVAAFERKGALHWRDRAIAAWVLGRANLSAQQRRVAAEALTQLVIYKPEAAGMWCLASCMLGLLVIPAILSSASRSHNLSLVRCEAMRSLGLLRDPGCLGAVTNVIEETRTAWSTDLRNEAMRAMPELVAALTHEYYGLLPMQTIPNLCRALNDRNPLISSCAIEAIAKIGDGRAIPAMEDLAKDDAGSPLRDRAREVLPILYERRRNETNKQTLLRAYEAPVEGQYVLLRPAAAGEGEASEVLLRPVGEEP